MFVERLGVDKGYLLDRRPCRWPAEISPSARGFRSSDGLGRSCPTVPAVGHGELVGNPYCNRVPYSSVLWAGMRWQPLGGSATGGFPGLDHIGPSVIRRLGLCGKCNGL